MNMKNRVVVTGMGAITPIGSDVESFWNDLKEKKVDIGSITYFDTTGYKTEPAAGVKDFNAKNYMDPKTAKRMGVFPQFAMAASREVLENSGLDIDKGNPFRVSISVGSGTGSFRSVERGHRELLKKGPNRVNPPLVPMMIGNMAVGNVAIQSGLRGKRINMVTACATGIRSAGKTFRSIRYGEAEVMLAGDTEASVYPIGVAGFTVLTALNTTEDPMKASVPFDKGRSGFVMGEGAGAMVLESLEHAKARGTHICAEVVGYGATCDAHHITSPVEGGGGAAMVMAYATQDAGAMPEGVNCINAHGASTHHNDLFETKAIKTALGDHAYGMHINSMKSMIGHLLGAAGGVKFITCVKSIEEGCVHTTTSLEVDGEEYDSNYTKGEGVSAPVHYAISNSFGFGEHNASILVKRFEK